MECFLDRIRRNATRVCCSATAPQQCMEPDRASFGSNHYANAERHCYVLIQQPSRQFVLCSTRKLVPNAYTRVLITPFVTDSLVSFCAKFPQMVLPNELYSFNWILHLAWSPKCKSTITKNAHATTESKCMGIQEWKSSIFSGFAPIKGRTDHVYVHAMRRYYRAENRRIRGE